MPGVQLCPVRSGYADIPRRESCGVSIGPRTQPRHSELVTEALDPSWATGRLTGQTMISWIVDPFKRIGNLAPQHLLPLRIALVPNPVIASAISAPDDSRQQIRPTRAAHQAWSMAGETCNPTPRSSALPALSRWPPMRVPAGVRLPPSRRRRM